LTIALKVQTEKTSHACIIRKKGTPQVLEKGGERSDAEEICIDGQERTLGEEIPSSRLARPKKKLETAKGP